MIYIDVTRAAHTTSDVMQESRIDDYWNIDGSRDLSDSWTGFTQFTLLKEKPPEGYTWSGRRLTKRQATSRPDYLWPEICKDMSKNSNLKEAKLGNRETEARQYQKAERYLLQWPWGRRIQRNYQENAQRKWEVPIARAMPCKKTNNWPGKPVAQKTIVSLNLHASL